MRYNGANTNFTVNGREIHKFKAKGSECVAAQLYLVEISKNCTAHNVKKTGLWTCL